MNTVNDIFYFLCHFGFFMKYQYTQNTAIPTIIIRYIDNKMVGVSKSNVSHVNVPFLTNIT